MAEYIRIDELIKEVKSFIRGFNYNDASQIDVLNSYNSELGNKIEYVQLNFDNYDYKDINDLKNLLEYMDKLYSYISDLCEHIAENNVGMIEQEIKELKEYI